MVEAGEQNVNTEVLDHVHTTDPDGTPTKNASDGVRSPAEELESSDDTALDWDTLKRTELHEKLDSSMTPIDTIALRERLQRKIVSETAESKD